MNHKILFFLFILSFSLFAKKAPYKWAVSDSIKTPESVYYDSESNKIFVANIDGAGTDKDGKGHISLLDTSGKMIDANWLTGLNAPKGMRAKDGFLWVSDIDQVIKINISKKEVVKRYAVSGAVFLNDIAIDNDGVIYISDTLTSKIHTINEDEVSTFVEGEQYESPNGLLVIGDELYVAAWGLTTDWSTKVDGRLYKININSKKITYISKEPLGHLDGLEINKNGDFLVSDWSAGKIYKIKPNGKTKMIYQGKKGLADIGLMPDQTILIPMMNDNQIQGI